MCAADQERAVLIKLQSILKRLQPLVKDIVECDLAWHSSVEETNQLKSSLAESMKKMKKNLGNLDIPSDKSS